LEGKAEGFARLALRSPRRPQSRARAPAAPATAEAVKMQHRGGDDAAPDGERAALAPSAGGVAPAEPAKAEGAPVLARAAEPSSQQVGTRA